MSKPTKTIRLVIMETNWPNPVRRRYLFPNSIRDAIRLARSVVATRPPNTIGKRLEVKLARRTQGKGTKHARPSGWTDCHILVRTKNPRGVGLVYWSDAIAHPPDGFCILHDKSASTHLSRVDENLTLHSVPSTKNCASHSTSLALGKSVRRTRTRNGAAGVGRGEDRRRDIGHHLDRRRRVQTQKKAKRKI